MGWRERERALVPLPPLVVNEVRPMIARLCGEEYTRPDGTTLACHYLWGHPQEQHSWFAAMSQDQLGNNTAPDIETLLDGINDGYYDPYLEAILAGAHARKRALRGVVLPYGLAGGPVPQ